MVNMKSSLVALAYAAIAAAQTATPTPTKACNRDNCFRQLIQSPALVSPFCATYTQPPAALPTFVSACQGLSSRVSSACSCLHPAATATAGSCNRDNCFRQLIQSPDAVGPFCASYTAPPAPLPTFVSACQGLSSRVSSACSCLHPATTSSSTTSSATSTPSAGVTVRVSSSGGNATNGHQYGFLHEVSRFHVLCVEEVAHAGYRISTTLVTEVSMLS